jgi:cellulose synthase/poly-beta-1,6-N-acetylglucosamine synthase-like glycosyltransferase
MIVVFLIFAALLVWFSFKSLRGGLTYLSFFKTELARPLPEWTPFVTVICPCRGVDEGMEKNLVQLLRQDYPDYEVIFVVDDAADPAAELIRPLTDGHRRGVSTIGDSGLVSVKLVIAGKATDSAQKIENLREAVLHADEPSKVFIFVDSDTRVSLTWLRYLVEGVEPDNIGAATGYRWFIPEKRTFAAEMCSVWNASVASTLGPNTKSNFCWGGSTAMRRDVFESIGIRDKWQGTLSDDFVLTRAVREAGLDIVHVPQALTVTLENCTLRKLLEFTTRQMKITRVYMPHLWLMSFFGSTVFCGVMLTAFLIVVLSRENTFAVWASITTLALVSGFSAGKSWLRLQAVRLALPQYQRELRRQFFTQNTLWLLSPALFLYNSITALFSRRMVWRGTTYELKSPTETVIIRP